MPEHVTVSTLLLVGEDEDPEREAEAAAAAMPRGQAVYFAGRGHVGVWPGAPKESVEQALPVSPSCLGGGTSGVSPVHFVIPRAEHAAGAA